MKKSIIILTLATMLFGSVSNTNAQDNNNERESRRAEMQGRQKERLIRDLKLTDEQRAKFEPIYENYQKELAALRPERQQADGETGASQQNKKEKQELTDAVAAARLQALFDRQAEQIQQSQQRLDIQKKYCAEFSSVLNPQQLLRVFQPLQQRNGQHGGQQGFRGGQGGPRGGQGGPRGGFGGGQSGFGGGPQGDF